MYAYSLNGENWMGAFETRDGALAAAIQKCSGAVDRPSTVFVAEIAGGEAFASRLGKVIVEEMRNRARTRGAEGASRYLGDLTAAQIGELDASVEKTAIGWLQKHKLMPESFKVASISEHLVPLPGRGLSRSSGGGSNGESNGGANNGNGKEVHDLGVGDFPGDSR